MFTKKVKQYPTVSIKQGVMPTRSDAIAGKMRNVLHSIFHASDRNPLVLHFN